MPRLKLHTKIMLVGFVLAAVGFHVVYFEFLCIPLLVAWLIIETRRYRRE